MRYLPTPAILGTMLAVIASTTQATLLDMSKPEDRAVYYFAIENAGKGAPRTRQVTAGGDDGIFQDADTNHDIMLVPPNDPQIVGRYRSSYGNKYRFWISDSTYPGATVVLLKDRPHFDRSLTWFGNRESKGAHWCEIVENPWGAWSAVGNIPSACGAHSYTERRLCSTVDKADKPCPDSCPQSQQTRTASVDNGRCNTAPTVQVVRQNVTGFDGTEFTPDYGYYDAENNPVQLYWSVSGGCRGISNTGRWVNATSDPVIRRDLSRGTACTVSVAARDFGNPDGSALVNASAAQFSGAVVADCNDVDYFAPDGRTPEAYAEDCSVPATFLVRTECSTREEEFDCTGGVPECRAHSGANRILAPCCGRQDYFDPRRIRWYWDGNLIAEEFRAATSSPTGDPFAPDASITLDASIVVDGNRYYRGALVSPTPIYHWDIGKVWTICREPT